MFTKYKEASKTGAKTLLDVYKPQHDEMSSKIESMNIRLQKFELELNEAKSRLETMEKEDIGIGNAGSETDNLSSEDLTEAQAKTFKTLNRKVILKANKKIKISLKNLLILFCLYIFFQ